MRQMACHKTLAYELSYHSSPFPFLFNHFSQISLNCMLNDGRLSHKLHPSFPFLINTGEAPLNFNTSLI